MAGHVGGRSGAALLHLRHDRAREGDLHAHRYILAHEEFVYCNEVQDGELDFHVPIRMRRVGVSPTDGGAKG